MKDGYRTFCTSRFIKMLCVGSNATITTSTATTTTTTTTNTTTSSTATIITTITYYYCYYCCCCYYYYYYYYYYYHTTSVICILGVTDNFIAATSLRLRMLILRLVIMPEIYFRALLSDRRHRTRGKYFSRACGSIPGTGDAYFTSVSCVIVNYYFISMLYCTLRSNCEHNFGWRTSLLDLTYLSMMEIFSTVFLGHVGWSWVSYALSRSPLFLHGDRYSRYVVEPNLIVSTV